MEVDFTVYGIETQHRIMLHLDLRCYVAIVLTVYGIETCSEFLEPS